MTRNHIYHPKPGQIWGPGQEPESVREACDRQTSDRAQVRGAERQSETEREREPEAG